MPTVSKWEFSSREAAEKALLKIHWELGTPSAYRFGTSIEIDAECRDISKAAQICQAYGGSPA